VLPFELSNQQGLRTLTTTVQYNQIPGMKAGTTSRLSVLYATKYAVYLPYVSAK
jgi:hypothetical protein